MSRTPEQIKRARALAASIDKDAQVFAITDRNFEGRATRLIHAKRRNPAGACDYYDSSHR